MILAIATILYALLPSLAYAQFNSTCFQNDGSVLITPQDGNYNNDRLIFNEKIQRKPVAIAYAYTEQQVQDLVLCARQNALQLSPRGGGHGYEGIVFSSFLFCFISFVLSPLSFLFRLLLYSCIRFRLPCRT